MTAPRTPAGPPCPRCGAARVPIVYGYPPSPDPDTSAKVSVVLGGCVVDNDAARWWCETCSTDEATDQR
jgi:hypothetical protein